MVFTVLGAVAELQRSLIVERVKADLRSAKAKGKQLGRPKKTPRHEEDRHAARQGRRLEADRCTNGVGVGTIYSVALNGSKNRERVS
jgi:putative DNA-invertase from lambdoid prophage Rac